ncbi:MAG: SMP-30/gluconolactonase/LRE family protein [Deltaproteobacteria bacterium]|nr:SMP-30/gluconolactonase/LRE family protein [Deltaproteobacteria bacterium]
MRACPRADLAAGRARRLTVPLFVLLSTAPAFALPTPLVRPLGRPDALVDLRTDEGLRLVAGRWRYHDVHLVDVDAKGPGPDLKPSGAAVRTHDYTPKAGAADFDDSAWDVLAPTTLDARRANGKLCFAWYRLSLTIPKRIGGFDPTGSTVAFEIVIDDYAEVWVDGKLAPVLGQTGGAVVAGFNAPNRVIIGRNVKPGRKIQLAVFGMNDPISTSPNNFIWIKSATLDFFKPQPIANVGEIERLDPALDAIVPRPSQVEKLAGGFLFTEGPIWVRDGGYLLFSDPNDNRIYRFTADGELSVFRTKSGYTGADIAEYGQPGSNGLTLDREGRLTIDECGNHRVSRLEKNGQLTVLADRYDGKRLNSPNDLVYKSDGALYFTDPPFGLPKFFADPRKELPFSGVYRVADGTIQLLTKDLTGPNGLAFSPDEHFLYVDNWDVAKKVIMRYPVAADGTLGTGEVFLDITTSEPGEQAFDGLKVDQKGNVYVSAPGGVWILSPTGKHLGTIKAPEQPANFAWGDDDGRALYITARTGLYRIRLQVPGVRP